MIEKGLFQFCGKTKKYIAQAVFINCIKLVANIVFSFMFASIISYFLTGIFVIDLKISMILIGLSLITRQICTRIAVKKNNKVISEVKHNLRTAIYEKVITMGSLYQEKMTTQEIVHIGVEGVEQLENYFGSYLTQFYYSFISTFILFLVLLPISKPVAIVMLVLAPLIPLFLLLILKIVKNVQKKYWSKYADVGNLFLDSLQGMTTLKVFMADKKRAEDLDEMSEGFRNETMRVLKMQLNSIMIIDWIAYGGAAAGIIVAIHQFAAGNIGTYQLVAIFLLIADFFVPMRLLTSLFHIAMTGVSAGEKMLDFLSYEDNIEYGKKEFVEGDVIIEEMDYFYADKTHAIKNISMKFEQGSLTAIVGPSGCGKSTLASIIAGQYRQPKNSIIYGGIEAYSLKRGEVGKNVVRISHDGHIFSGTVRSNLLIGNKMASEEEMIEVLKEVSLWEVFSQEKGLDSEVLSEGKNLSGGQAQRLSLARALIHNASVYIFDEATSNIDVESEEVILGIIEKISKKKTVIFISHRLQSIVKADKIYVMKDGSLVEEGKHKELLLNKGLYSSLFIQQEELEKFREGGVKSYEYKKECI